VIHANSELQHELPLRYNDVLSIKLILGRSPKHTLVLNTYSKCSMVVPSAGGCKRSYSRSPSSSAPPHPVPPLPPGLSTPSFPPHQQQSSPSLVPTPGSSDDLQLNAHASSIAEGSKDKVSPTAIMHSRGGGGSRTNDNSQLVGETGDAKQSARTGRVKHTPKQPK
jgi:hypothetical protein